MWNLSLYPDVLTRVFSLLFNHDVLVLVPSNLLQVIVVVGNLGISIHTLVFIQSMRKDCFHSAIHGLDIQYLSIYTFLLLLI